MITTYHSPGLTWIDLENPEMADIESLIKERQLHPRLANELLRPTERAKVDTDESTFYAVLHYPDHPAKSVHVQEIEIDYVVFKDLLITAHYAPIDVFFEMGKKFQADQALDRNPWKTAPELFLALNNELYRGLREELEPVRQQIKEIETAIFEGHEFGMVRKISEMQRRLLDFKQAIRSHKIILKSFESHLEMFFPKIKFDHDVLLREYSRVENALENNRELLKELHETNDSLLSAKTNDVTKKLTLMAFVTFPLTLVATVLGFHTSPAVFQGPNGFWIIVAILVALFVLMQSYFVYKKWI